MPGRHRTRRGFGTGPPCPVWCDQPAGHGYSETPTSAGIGAYGRDHTLTFGGDTGAAITAYAMAVSDGTPEDVDIDGIAVWTNGNTSGEVITADQARELAANLLAAADKLDQITRR